MLKRSALEFCNRRSTIPRLEREQLSPPYVGGLRIEWFSEEVVLIARTARFISLALIGFGSLALAQAKPTAELKLLLADAGPEDSIAAQLVPSPFRISDYWSTHGSGGFAEGFSDEHRRVDKWQQ